jgi:DNA-binding XRE family transcriptional regulator
MSADNPRENTRRMNAGELRTVREYLGLLHTTLAEVLGVRADTSRRWEGGRREPIPANVRDEIALIERTANETVSALVKTLSETRDPAVIVYRTNEDFAKACPEMADLGARWWRGVVARARLHVLADIGYEDELDSEPAARAKDVLDVLSPHISALIQTMFDDLDTMDPRTDTEEEQP